jgi:hypothetical protein
MLLCGPAHPSSLPRVSLSFRASFIVPNSVSAPPSLAPRLSAPERFSRQPVVLGEPAAPRDAKNLSRLSTFDFCPLLIVSLWHSPSSLRPWPPRPTHHRRPHNPVQPREHSLQVRVPLVKQRPVFPAANSSARRLSILRKQRVCRVHALDHFFDRHKRLRVVAFRIILSINEQLRGPAVRHCEGVRHRPAHIRSLPRLIRNRPRVP